MHVNTQAATEGSFVYICTDNLKIRIYKSIKRPIHQTFKLFFHNDHPL